jgi:hypothetical protein
MLTAKVCADTEPSNKVITIMLTIQRCFSPMKLNNTSITYYRGGGKHAVAVEDLPEKIRKSSTESTRNFSRTDKRASKKRRVLKSKKHDVDDEGDRR